MAIKNKATLTGQANATLNDNSTGDISAADVRGMVVDLIDSSLNRTDDAGLLGLRLYSTSRSYAVGDTVYRDDKLYRCKTATSGTWNATRWQEINPRIVSISTQLSDACREAVLMFPDGTNIGSAYLLSAFAQMRQPNGNNINNNGVDGGIVFRLSADTYTIALSAANGHADSVVYNTLTSLTNGRVNSQETATVSLFPSWKPNSIGAVEVGVRQVLQTSAGQYAITYGDMPCLVRSDGQLAFVIDRTTYGNITGLCIAFNTRVLIPCSKGFIVFDVSDNSSSGLVTWAGSSIKGGATISYLYIEADNGEIHEIGSGGASKGLLTTLTPGTTHRYAMNNWSDELTRQRTDGYFETYDSGAHVFGSSYPPHALTDELIVGIFGIGGSGALCIGNGAYKYDSGPDAWLPLHAMGQVAYSIAYASGGAYVAGEHGITWFSLDDSTIVTLIATGQRADEFSSICSDGESNIYAGGPAGAGFIDPDSPPARNRVVNVFTKWLLL